MNYSALMTSETGTGSAASFDHPVRNMPRRRCLFPFRGQQRDAAKKGDRHRPRNEAAWRLECDHAGASPHFSRCQRGISVLEVLISIFIVAVGLLGVISMLPVGHLFVQNAIRADHASALAEKGFNDVMLRGWLSNLALDKPVAVDPLGGADDSKLGGSSLDRDNAGISVAMANEIFIGTDDVSYTEPDNLGDMPQVIFIKDENGADLKRGYYGRYSYLVTVVPQGAGSKLAKVSVAVFFNRNTVGETTVNATALGGSDVELTGADLEIKKNQWILLEDAASDYYQWFRVVVTGDDAGTGKTWVSLDGPSVPASFSGTAILFDQVLSVYERTVTIE